MKEDIVEQARERISLQGQVGIVTGACGGVGLATCAALARVGANVVAVDLDENRVQRVIEELVMQIGQESAAGQFLGLGLDVRRELDMQKMVEETLSRFERLDILIASAGILRPKEAPLRLLAHMPVAEWDEVLETNLKGVFLSNRAVLPAMLHQRSGQIINISSVAGRRGRAYDSAYCASKFAVIGLSESLAEEVRTHNIRVHVLLPDAIDTPMWNQNSPIPRPEFMLPAARVADFIVYLLLLPEDTVLVSPVIAPFHHRRRAARATKPTREI
jgi:3-oxoacyl-[acyl-carrier protein] reductase